MDFDPKYRENFPSHLPSCFHENPPRTRDDHFSYEGFVSSRVTNNFLQDFEPHEIVTLNGSSSSSTTPNPMFPIVQTNFLDSFDNPQLGCLPPLDFFESKPFENHAPTHHHHHHGVLVPLLESFNNQNNANLGHPQMMNNNNNNNNNPINMISPTSQSYTPFNYYEFDPNLYRPSHEGSCSTHPPNDVTTIVSNAISMMTTARKGKRGRKKKTTVVKGQWTAEEDRLLMQLVERYGIRKWSQIAQLLQGRIGKQCRERWHNHLRPNIKKEVWSEEEDRILIKAHIEIGNKWAEIAKRLPGRTENSIKNHWNATKRRQFSRRRCRSKCPKQSSLLQEYIKSLNPETVNAGCRKKISSSSNKGETSTSAANIMPLNQLDDQTNSSHSSSTEDDPLVGQEYEFSDQVPDFNFDAQMLEESSIDSLLDCAPHDHVNGGCEGGHGDGDGYGHQYEQGQGSSELMNDIHIEVCPNMQHGVKRELDLVEMINQVNL